MMNALLRQIWQFEFGKKPDIFTDTRWIKLAIWVIAIGFAIFTVMISSVVPGSHSVSIFNIQEIIRQYQDGTVTAASFRAFLPYVWVGVALLAVATRSIITIHSYYLSVKKIGEHTFNRYFTTFITTFLIGTATLLLITFIGWITLALGHDADWVGSVIDRGVHRINALLAGWIPFSLHLNNYVLSFLLTILIAPLPGYVVHFLCHRSRLLWLLAHRPHHCPVFLYPLAAPNNNIAILEFVMAIPGVIFFIVVSGMIYHEPLTIELAIWFTLGLSIESFNHSSAHYDFALRNPIVRNMSRIFGGMGVYHLVHHSAYQQDQNVNFGTGPLMFWDRLFGTYRKPYEKEPPIGLTDQPPIHMNPFRIVFNGFLQLAYEWKMNKDWRIRWKILFGDVWYKPPMTKDFLVVKKG